MPAPDERGAVPAPKERSAATAAALFLAVAVLAGCGDRGTRAERPVGESDVPDSLLIEILADLHMVDARRYLTMRDDSAAVDQTGDEADTINAVLARLHDEGAPVDSVLRVHGSTRGSYDAALDWYVDHPEQFVHLYNRILDRLNQAP